MSFYLSVLLMWITQHPACPPVSRFRYEHAGFRDGSELNYTFHLYLNNTEWKL